MSSDKDEVQMDAKTYIMTQMRIIEMGKIADSLDIDTFLVVLNRAMAVAPLADPTLFMKAQKNMQAIKRLAVAAKEMQTAFDETYASVMATAAAGFMQKTSNEIEVKPND